MTFRKRILLVNHQPYLTRMVRRLFAQDGDYLIREENDDHLALHAVRWFRPDLILLDGEDISLKKALRKDPFAIDTPIVCLQHAAEARVASSGILSGYSFFATPLALEEVVRAVIEMLRGN